MSDKIRLDNLGGTIYYKNEKVVSFKYERDILIFVSEINRQCSLLPYEFLNVDRATDHLIRCFFDARIVPETRIGLNELLAKTEIQYYYPERIIRYQSGRCIHDEFWLKCDDDRTCWD